LEPFVWILGTGTGAVKKGEYQGSKVPRFQGFKVYWIKKEFEFFKLKP
jgi:hypothetical protein